MRLNQCVAIALCGVALASTAQAEQIYKCIGDDGKVIYQKQPCDKSQIEQQKDINPDRNTVKMEGPPPSEAPKAAGPAPAPTTVIRRRGGY